MPKKTLKPLTKFRGSPAQVADAQTVADSVPPEAFPLELRKAAAKTQPRLRIAGRIKL